MNSNPSHQADFEQWKCCMLIPTYNNSTTLREVIETVGDFTKNILVVNDGSTDETSTILKDFQDEIHIYHLEQNSGKGVALHTGFKKALELGYDYALTIDSDGQHLASDIPTFLEAMEENPGALLVGARNMELENVPGTSSFGHRFSNFWYRIMTGNNLPDTQSGYRLYPIAALKNLKYFTTKYEFEMEALVRSSWMSIPALPVPINVYYPPQDERVTHFRTIIDFSRITILNTFLVIIALLYARPLKFFRDLKKKSFKDFWNNYIVNNDESNAKITYAVMLGLFIGVSPFWGYQIVLIIFFCVVLKLNKIIALIAGHISIPPMIPVILYGSYWIGSWFLGKPATGLNFSKGITFEMVAENMLQYVTGAFLLGILLAAILGMATYVLLLVFRNHTKS